MTDTTIETIAADAATAAIHPATAAILDDLHDAASADAARIEAGIPARLTTAEATIQTYVSELTGALHNLIARINTHRTGNTPDGVIKFTPPTEPANVTVNQPIPVAQPEPTPPAAPAEPTATPDGVIKFDTPDPQPTPAPTTPSA